MSAVFKTEVGRAAVQSAYRALLVDWPLAIEQFRVPTRFGETHVVACGPKGAPPLVALHGAQANAAAYLGDAAVWSRDFRVYAIDMIGEAGLSAEIRPALDGDAHALWLDDVLDGLGVTRAAFVGTSLGGWLALDYATRRPQRVERLALLCPSGIGRQKNLLLKVLPLLLLGPWGMNKVRELVFGPRPAMPTPLQQRFGALMELIGRHIRIRIVTIPRLTDAQLAALPPALVIIGGKDVLLDSRDTKARLEQHAPAARAVFLPEGYHYLPGRTEPIAAFLRQPPVG
ncbi:MAG: alpha/beta fold hydrolase [Alphaproteobacteria bacterium]|nr:alpha/beta fold hydrolase [Alphaproteobacteria bacterium]